MLPLLVTIRQNVRNYIAFLMSRIKGQKTREQTSVEANRQDLATLIILVLTFSLVIGGLKCDVYFGLVVIRRHIAKAQLLEP